jgi:adenine-specific DNA-methyltransferase
LKEGGNEGNWRWGMDTAKEKIDTLIARFMPNRGIYGVFEKDFLEGRPLVKSTSAWVFKEVNSERGSEQFIGLGFDKYVFSRPKPIGLLGRLLSLCTSGSGNELILDFFAGSGTTGHAVMGHNSEDGGARRYILVQLPEPVDSDKSEQKSAADLCDQLGKSRSLAEITKERLRRAGNKIRNENPLIASDLGFRVFKLASSNIRAWDPDRDKIAETLEASIEHLKTDRTEQDILFELLLKLGLDLCVPIETRRMEGTAGQIHDIHSIGGGSLNVCLSHTILQADVEPLALALVSWHQELKPAGDTTVVFRDSAFADDVAKTNMTAILQQNGLETVRSL